MLRRCRFGQFNDYRIGDLVMYPLLAGIEGYPEEPDAQRQAANDVPEEPQEGVSGGDPGSVAAQHFDIEKHIPGGLAAPCPENDAISYDDTQ
jgi:hypothetical protein